MAARASSLSNDSRIVKMPLPNSVLLKDYLLDDLSSCSSNGFRSYPRQQCCTKVIEIDLNKHIKLPPSRKQFLKNKSKAKPKLKSKSSSVLHKASAAVANVFKNFQFSGSGKPRKAKFLPRNLSRKLSKHGFWKRTTDQNNKVFKRLNSFDEPIKQKKKVLPPVKKGSTTVTTTTEEMKTTISNSNSWDSSETYFTVTSDSSTTCGSSKINVAQNDVEESERRAMEKINIAIGENAAVATATNANGNAKKEQQSKEKDEFSPVSVMDFPHYNNNDNDDEVTSPFRHSHVYIEGSKRKCIPKVQRSQLKPVRLEDRINLSDQKKAIALLQLLKATMPCYDLSESKSVLLGFFTEKINEGNTSDYVTLQEAKDWINNQKRLTFENNKVAYIRDIEKGAKWLTYGDQVERRKVGLELECEVFASLVQEMLLDFYL